MEKLEEQLVQIYLKKFSLSPDEIKTMMYRETWISDSDIGDFNFDAELESGSAEYAIAASVKNYKHVPEDIMKRIEFKNETSEETKKTDEEVSEDTVSTEPDETQKPDEETTEEESEQKEGKCDEDPKDADDDDDKGSEDDGDVKTPDENEEDASTDEDADEEEVKGADEEVSNEDADEEDPEVKNELARLVDRLSACESKRRDFQAKCDKLASENRILKDKIEKLNADASAVKNQLESEKNELEKRLARLADSVFKVETEEFVDSRSHKEILASLPPSERAAYYKKHRDAIDR